MSKRIRKHIDRRAHAASLVLVAAIGEQGPIPLSDLLHRLGHAAFTAGMELGCRITLASTWAGQVYADELGADMPNRAALQRDEEVHRWVELVGRPRHER